MANETTFAAHDSSNDSAIEPVGTGSNFAGEQTRLLRNLIWLYLILWLIEGGLRRWFFPSLATPLLLVRDPLVLAIYLVAIWKNLFPLNWFIVGGAILAYLTFANALIFGHGNLMVAIYGVRCDFLHVPLLFVMAKVLTQKDVIAMAKVGMWLVVPYTALLVAQFYSPQDAWVNRGVGDSMEGAGFSGALGRFRPPGTFSFINGPVELYPIFTACLFVLVLTRNISTILLIVSGMAILVAIPVSVSRFLFFNVSVVIIVGAAALFIGGRFSTRVVFQLAIAAAVLPLIVTHFPPFNDGMETFKSRWTASTTDSGGFQEAVVDRMLDTMFGAFHDANMSKLGTGYSTNVGQKLLTQDVGFGASEGEWGRLLYDNGLFLGSLLVGYRIMLTGFIFVSAFHAWRRQSTIGLLFTSAAFLLLLNGEWGQASTQGGAIIAGGIALAASGGSKMEKLHESCAT